MKYANKNKIEWVAKADNKVEQRMQTIERREQKSKEHEELKKTPQYKLEIVRNKIKAWETRKKRAETYLKKLGRREKLLLHKLEVKS